MLQALKMLYIQYCILKFLLSLSPSRRLGGFARHARRQGMGSTSLFRRSQRVAKRGRHCVWNSASPFDLSDHNTFSHVCNSTRNWPFSCACRHCRARFLRRKSMVFENFFARSPGLEDRGRAHALIFLVRMQRALSLALVTCFTFAILIIINIEYYILISHFL